MAHQIKQNEVESKQIRIFLYCTVIQQPSKFLFLKQSIIWKQAIRFFIEYGTAERLRKRTKHCMAVLSPTQATKIICTIAVDF